MKDSDLVLQELHQIYSQCLRECGRNTPGAAEFRETIPAVEDALRAIGDALQGGEPTGEDIASLVRLSEAARNGPPKG